MSCRARPRSAPTDPLAGLRQTQDVIYLDYKKAFDTVPHQKLLQKLKRLRLGDVLTEWIEQFLLGRQMRVHVNGSFSSLIDVISGVPQGSVLGPLLFLIFVNDLSDCVKSSILMFADDTNIWTKIKDTRDSDLLQCSEYVNGMVEAMVTCLQHGKV